MIRNDLNNSPHSSLNWTLLLSVALHLFLIQEFVSDTPTLSPTQPSQEPVEVTQLSPDEINALEKLEAQKRKEIQIANSEDANNREEDPNAQFLSDKTQKALQESRASRTDDFRKKIGSGLQAEPSAKESYIPPSGKSAGAEESAETEEEVPDSEGPIASKEAEKKGIKRDWKTLSLRDLSINGADGLPEAATDDYLTGIQSAERTILSTREYKYFSYYERIRQLLRQHWKPSVERELVKLWRKGRQLGESEKTTKLLVLLNPGGKIFKISRLATSGVQEIDNAAVHAFENAGPFPNPPKGIVDDDGFVRIRWDFIVKTESAPKIEFQRGNIPNPP